jgi:hypothetical protein
MKKISIVPIILLAGLCTLAQLGRPVQAEADVVKNIVLYIPNRVFDLMDIVRFRVRVGPGISAGVRATRPLSAFLGMHSSVFVGLPGPRGKRSLPLPVGFDLRSGAQVSLADVSAGTPYYDFLEVGGELQLFIVGANVGIGVIEILDFFTGFVFIDLVGDDLGRGSEDEDEADEAEEPEGDNETEAGEAEADEPEADEPEAVEIEVDETEVIEPEADEAEAEALEADEPEADAPED